MVENDDTERDACCDVCGGFHDADECPHRKDKK